MKSILLFLLLAIGFTLLNAQSTAQGKIIDATTKAAIPFANIGFKRFATGTVSDENGNYQLNVISPRDTVSISSIGYEERNTPASALLKDGNIALIPRAYNIQEVEVKAEILEEMDVLLGNGIGKQKQNVGFGSRQLGTEIGALIKIEKETFIKSAHFMVNHAAGDSVLFRVNLYAVKDGKPLENLLKENVIIAARQMKGKTIEVDLSSYNIITDQDVLLSLEWIKDDQGKGNVGMTFRAKKSHGKDNLYTKETSFASFRKLSALVPMAPHLYLGFYLTAKQVK